MKTYRSFYRPKATSFVEYTVLILAVAAAVMIMQGYLKGALCGKMRNGVDNIGFGRQYQPLGN